MKLRRSILGVVLVVLCVSGCGDGLPGADGSKTAVDSKAKQTHEVVITDVSGPSGCVQGDIVPVTVTVENQGNSSEEIEVLLTDVTAGKLIGRKSLTLSAAGHGGIDDICDLTFTGEIRGNQYFGISAVHGDVNGDGYNDLLVSASAHDDFRGRAYLYYGGKDMDNIADKVFTGENAGDGFAPGGGVDNSCMADMNNDGFADVIIGARYFNNSRGRVYIFYGGPDMDENADIVIDGEVPKSQYGFEITVGDVNGDGEKDLIVGAYEYEHFRGRVYLYYGPIASDTTVDRMFTGENAGDYLGFKLSARGDVDGDGCDDLLMGSWIRSSIGRAYLYYGAPGMAMDGICDVTFNSNQDLDDGFGLCMDLFDIDNDGHADVLIAARSWPGDGTFQGRVYLYWGSDRATMDNIADLVFTGEADAQASFGGNTVYAGYVNDDKYGDIIVGAYDYYHTIGQGCAYLFYGDTKTSMDIVYDHVFFEEHVGSQALFGKEAARICDLNNDGLADVVIGACLNDKFQGTLFLYWNKPPSSTEMKFHWDTTNVSTGNHILKVKANPLTRTENSVSSAKTITVGVKPTASGKEREPLEEQSQKGPGKSTALQETATPGVKKPTTSLTGVAVDGDIQQVKLHLASGTDINEKTISGDTALHYAIKYRHREVAELLIARGADINSRNRDGETPAHLAIKADQKEVLDRLIAKGASVSPAHLAAYGGDFAAVRESAKKKVSINAQDEGGLTLLHAAASGGQNEVAAHLLERGAKVNAHDRKKQTPLFCAASVGHKNVVELLLAKGANPNPARDPDRWTPLYAAVSAGYRDVVETLLSKGGDANAKALTGDTPLHVTTLRGDRDMAELLIIKGADLKARNARAGNTPLHLAVVAGYRDIVELLATKGADLNVKNSDGFTPLHYAVSTRRLSFWETQIGDSSTPKDLAIAELLVAHGADVNAKTNDGATPLSLALKGGPTEIVELLRKHGAKE